MQLSERRVSSDRLFKLLFHVIFWGFWLVLPMLNAKMDDDQKRYEFLRMVFPATLACVPFFYFNSEFLIKKFVTKGNITGYVLSLLALFAVFLISQFFIKDLVLDRPVKIYDSRTLFPVLFIISMSTLYGVIIYLSSQSRKTQEEQEEKLKSELSFLRSQISPHFIFNVLNSIVYLIKKEPKKAENVTLELSNLMRYMLYESENKQVNLSKEIEYLKNYIKLQEMRFGEDIKINLEIESFVNSNLVIEPMLLIPFVENAFKHGGLAVKNPEIDINLSLEEDKYLNFRVRNKKANNQNTLNEKDSGIGLKNVRRRVELLYPEAQNLEIKDKDGVFEISLKLLLKKVSA